jgi:hypothetical protein
MGLFDRLKNIFTNKSDVKSIQSIDNRFKSIEQPTQVSSQPIKSLRSTPIQTSTIPIYGENQESILSYPEISRDSYQLGLAAGYTGRSIKEIESSLGRIEAQMVTKDWFTIQLQQLDRRIEDIERALGIIKGVIPSIEQQKAAIIKRMPLTQRMEELLEIVKQYKEISFADLALKMNIDVSDLRSMLSIMTKRTNMIERFRVHRAGWIRYVEPTQTSSNV